jgi:hypothetical protein
MKNQTPIYHPIEMLPTLADLIRGELDGAESHRTDLAEARSRPHSLDDGTLDRLQSLYRGVLEMTDVYGQQIERWNDGDPLTDWQRREVDSLALAVKRLRACCTEILAMERELRQGSIDRILEMSDLEVAQAVMTGKLKLPGI